MQCHVLNFLYCTVFSLLVLHMSTFFSIFLVQRDFCLGQEASIGPVWSDVRAERLFVSNRTVRSIPAPVLNEMFGLVPPQTEHSTVIGVQKKRTMQLATKNRARSNQRN